MAMAADEPITMSAALMRKYEDMLRPINETCQDWDTQKKQDHQKFTNDILRCMNIDKRLELGEDAPFRLIRVQTNRPSAGGRAPAERRRNRVDHPSARGRALVVRRRNRDTTGDQLIEPNLGTANQFDGGFEDHLVEINVRFAEQSGRESERQIRVEEEHATYQGAVGSDNIRPEINVRFAEQSGREFERQIRVEEEHVTYQGAVGSDNINQVEEVERAVAVVVANDREEYEIGGMNPCEQETSDEPLPTNEGVQLEEDPSNPVGSEHELPSLQFDVNMANEDDDMPQEEGVVERTELILLPAEGGNTKEVSGSSRDPRHYAKRRPNIIQLSPEQLEKQKKLRNDIQDMERQIRGVAKELKKEKLKFLSEGGLGKIAIFSAIVTSILEEIPTPTYPVEYNEIRNKAKNVLRESYGLFADMHDDDDDVASIINRVQLHFRSLGVDEGLELYFNDQRYIQINPVVRGQLFARVDELNAELHRLKETKKKLENACI